MIAREKTSSGSSDVPRGMLYCGGCGSAGYRSDKYCSCCGMSLTRRCGRCGAVVVHPVAYFCTECGVMLESGNS